MKNVSPTKVTDAEIRDFIDLFSQGMDFIITAGEKLCDLIERDPSVEKRILKKNKLLTAGALKQLRLIGSKERHPDLLFATGPGFNKLRSMPFEVQAEYIEKPVKMLCPDDDTHLLVRVKNMDKYSAEQVFAPDHIRTLPEQKAYLEARKALKRGEPSEDVFVVTPWRKVGRKIVVVNPCQLSLQDIRAMEKLLTKKKA